MAASSDPTPDAAIRKPKPAAPLPSSFWANAGMSTLKFMPTVATTPTVTTASRTISVCRT